MKKKLKKLIDTHEIVSFDIFDTLIKRNVQRPQDIYEIVQLIYEKREGKRIEHFAEVRYESECKLWKKQNGVMTYEQIYNLIYNLSESEKEKLKKIELEVEEKSYRKNPGVLEIVDYCVKSNKKIILISDMYLPKLFLEESIKKLYGNIFHRIYISCEVGLCKAKGEIYQFVLSELKTNSQNILHIGDDLVGDAINSRKNGYASYWLKVKKDIRPDMEFNKIDKILNSVIHADINNMHFINGLKKLGAETLGYLLYDFSYWLNRSIKKHDITEIYFLSREGRIFQKAYEVFFEKEHTHYLYLSRRSTSVPLIHMCKKPEDIFSIIKFRKEETIAGIFARLGIAYEDTNISFPADKIISRKKIKTKYFKQIVIENWELIYKNSISEYIMLMNYLKQEISSDKIAIVDIGWNGTMQKNLNMLMPELEIYGFYLELNNTKDSKMFSYGNNTIKTENLFAYRGIIESLFMANHGSTVCYKKEECFVPVLESIKNDDTTIIEEIQSGAIQYLKNHTEIIEELYDGICHPDVSMEILKKLINTPSMKEIEMLKEIHFFDVQNRKLIVQKKYSFREFADSDWKIAYLKRIFKLNIIVKMLICFMRKIK